jgi:hypothetical protein
MVDEDCAPAGAQTADIAPDMAVQASKSFRIRYSFVFAPVCSDNNPEDSVSTSRDSYGRPFMCTTCRTGK